MLGSRKLLIVLCIVPCVLSLVCIGAFAAPAEDVTPSVDLPLDTELVEDVVKSPSALAVETFPAQPLLESSYYKFTIKYGQLGAPAYSVTALGFSVSDSEGTFIVGASGAPAALFRSTSESNFGVSYAGTFYSLQSGDWASVTNYDVSFISYSPSVTIGDTTFTGTLVEESLVPDIAESVFDLGDALITFIMSSWVVMIPLAAWLVILCIGAIRKLVKGV